MRAGQIKNPAGFLGHVGALRNGHAIEAPALKLQDLVPDLNHVCEGKFHAWDIADLMCFVPGCPIKIGHRRDQIRRGQRRRNPAANAGFRPHGNCPAKRQDGNLGHQ